MKADEIMQVLRLTAMGRVNTPMQQEFADKLEALFAELARKPNDDYLGMLKPYAGFAATAEGLVDAVATTPLPDPTVDPVQYVQQVAKRGPGRPKKAE